MDSNDNYSIRTNIPIITVSQVVITIKKIVSIPTFFLMFLITIGFIIGLSVTFTDSIAIYYLEQLNYLVIRGYYYELVTSIFVTNSFTDYIFNFLSLYVVYLIFGSRAGKHEYTIFVLTGILGNILTVIFYNPYTLSSGASGGIFGLLSYYTFYDFLTRDNLGIYGLIFLVSVFGVSDLIFPNVNVIAHIGGVLGGIIYAVVYYLIRSSRTIK
ncbi:rhomboid family intramembrane serine protease [Saccharolobus solfataricus]|uniref:rhomboid family intramembrane serine protease n=1 Tax=Saccharolobus solfataricus TaxID=2287 RepID=UPI0004972C77